MFALRLIAVLHVVGLAIPDSELQAEDVTLRSKRATSCLLLEYREIDGSCNNVNSPEWGKTGTSYIRFLPPAYADGRGQMRRSVTGDELPSARIVSLHMVRDIDNEHPIGSHMVMQWGQLINHDITKKRTKEVSCCDDGINTAANNQGCHPILLPSDDPFFRKRCLSFSRSDFVNVNGVREQINDVTGFVDASPVYGSTEAVARSLRSFNGGKLKSLPRNFGKHLLPTMASDTNSFSSGDSRTNMIPSLVIVHVLLLREHNRIAENLAQLNPHWSDETLYQEARKIVMALVQKITYAEFLPTIMGSNNMRSLTLLDDGYFTGYDPTLNPTISNGFAVGAYRFGHSLVQSHLKRFTPDLREIPAPPLAAEFFNVSSILNRDGEVDRIVLGLINQHTQQADSSFSAQIQHNLFGTAGSGSDLYAINIQRGRDHGIPGYNAWRQFCGFRPFREFSELADVMSANAANTLRRIYAHIDDIDLYSAGMAEFAVPGGLVGPTFACAITRQFQNLRNGDRFWFENGDQTGTFSPDQLREVRKSSLARLICDNTDLIERMQPRAMHVPGRGNQLIPCEDIPGINLRAWQQGRNQQPSPGRNDVQLNNNNIQNFSPRPQLNNNVQSSTQQPLVTFPPGFPFHNSRGRPRPTVAPVQNNFVNNRNQNFPEALIRNQVQQSSQLPKPFVPSSPILERPSPPQRGNFPVHQKIAVSSSPPNRNRVQLVTARPIPSQQANDAFSTLPPGSAVFIPPKSSGARGQSNGPVPNELRNVSRFEPDRRFGAPRVQPGGKSQFSPSNVDRNTIKFQQTIVGSPHQRQQPMRVNPPSRPFPAGGNGFHSQKESRQRIPPIQNRLEQFGLQQSSNPVHIFFTQSNSRSRQPFTRLRTLRPQPGVVLRVPGLSPVHEDDDAFGYFVTF